MRRSSLRRYAVLLFVALGAPASAQSPGPGTITGVVDVKGKIERRTRPSVRALGADRSPARDDRTKSLVYLESAPRGAFESAGAAQRAVLDQRDETFFPHVVAVQTGATVDFPNSDDIYHNVFSLSKTRRFDLGRYANGESKSVRFDRPGEVRVFCEIHSHMTAYVLVFSHRFFAATDAGGSYRIEGVPAGRYKLVVWTDGRERASRWVEVAPGGVTEASFIIE